MKVNQMYISPWELMREISSHELLRSLKRTLGDKSIPPEVNDEAMLPINLSGEALLGQIKGSFQPLITTLSNFTRIFSRYKNNQKRLEDYGQFIYGMINVLLGVVMAAIAVVHCVAFGLIASGFMVAAGLRYLYDIGLKLGSFIPFIDSQRNSYSFKDVLTFSAIFSLLIFYMLLLSITWIMDAINTAARGILQIALYPLTLIIAIFVREPRTYLRGAPKVEDNAGVQSLVEKITTKEDNSYYLIERLHEKYLKGVGNGQSSVIVPSKEFELFSEARKNYAKDEKSAFQYVGLFKPSVNASEPLEALAISPDLKM